MDITELRYGKEDGYKVQFIDELPKDKIIIALHEASTRAFLVIMTERYDINKTLELFPITHFEYTNRLAEYTTEETLLQDTGFKIYALNNLGDFQKIKNAWAYK